MKLSAHQTLLPGADLSSGADEDALITQLLLAILGAVTEHAAGDDAVYFEPLNRYETTYLNTVGAADELCRAADSQHWLPGHGHIDFVGAFRALREIEFDGWQALECMSTPGDPLSNMRACVAYLRRCWERAEPED